METKHDSDPGGAVVDLHRRDFLVLGSVAMVGLAATNLRGDVLKQAAAPMPLLSIGFWNGSVDEMKSETPSRRVIVPADRLVAADPSLVDEGARITVHGFWRGAANRSPLTLGLRAVFPEADPALPFIAWSWRPNSRVSNTARFDMPVGDTLDLVVERLHDAASPAPRRLRELFGAKRDVSRVERTAMSSVTGSRGVKLRKGVYFFAVRESESETLPSWSSIRIANSPSALDATATGILRASAADRVPFSYLVVSVDSVKA